MSFCFCYSCRQPYKYCENLPVQRAQFNGKILLEEIPIFTPTPTIITDAVKIYLERHAKIQNFPKFTVIINAQFILSHHVHTDVQSHENCVKSKFVNFGPKSATKSNSMYTGAWRFSVHTNPLEEKMRQKKVFTQSRFLTNCVLNVLKTSNFYSGSQIEIFKKLD